MLIINHPGLPKTLKDCQERNNVNTTTLAELTQIKIDQLIAISKKKFKGFVASATTASSLLDKHDKCTKKFWQYIKGMRKEQISIKTLCYNGQTYTDSEGKANALNNQFVSVFTNEDKFPLPYIPNELTPNIALIMINVEGIFNLLT